MANQSEAAILGIGLPTVRRAAPSGDARTACLANRHRLHYPPPQALPAFQATISKNAANANTGWCGDTDACWSGDS